MKASYSDRLPLALKLSLALCALALLSWFVGIVSIHIGPFKPEIANSHTAMVIAAVFFVGTISVLLIGWFENWGKINRRNWLIAVGSVSSLTTFFFVYLYINGGGHIDSFSGALIGILPIFCMMNVFAFGFVEASRNTVDFLHKFYDQF
jgi:hypothetical protein